MTRYHGFRNFEDLMIEFDCKDLGIDDSNILIASYECGGYEGDAFILIEKDNKFYTVECSHCSCNDLDGNWDMIETTKEVMKKRTDNIYRHPELKEFIEKWCNE